MWRVGVPCPDGDVEDVCSWRGYLHEKRLVLSSIDDRCRWNGMSRTMMIERETDVAHVDYNREQGKEESSHEDIIRWMHVPRLSLHLRSGIRV